ncbi:serine/threonine protein kinase [Streptomyces sp. YGL11-2]|uniref:serine/threonine protein kinase n=1 Tax=Streptomyces sp. YGL11-2 TaxID=3414028 RepID=UPI003CF88215
MRPHDAPAGDPRRFDAIGPYIVLTALDDAASPVPVPERRYVARSADGDRTVLISLPLPGVDAGRFLAEAETSRYLLGRWSAPATELAAPGEPPWHARPYLPVLPLPAALAAYGGPLPERTVRAMGAALVETLAIGHGQGLAHAGVCPAAVLLAADGPRLTCFGAVRTAAGDGAPRSGLPGLESGSLPPEQAAGERPLPAGDVYALGATLAYAATGHTVPERDEIPAGLRALVGACLSRDPAARPRPAELLDALVPAAGTDGADGPVGTGGANGTGGTDGAEGPVDRATAVLAAVPAAAPARPAAVADAPADRAAAVLGPGWLPGRVIAALARQSAALLAVNLPEERRAAPAAPAPAPPAETPVPAGATLPMFPAHRQPSPALRPASPALRPASPALRPALPTPCQD